MNTKITEAFRMTKRRVAGNHERSVSKSLKVGEKSPDVVSLRSSYNKPNDNFPTPKRTSTRLFNKISPQTRSGLSLSKNRGVTSRSSPCTPSRRSPRINNGLSRINNANQEIPCSQEAEITWKWNSPIHERTLRSKRNLDAKGDLKDIVQMFVPSRSSSSSSLLDLWMAPCEMKEVKFPTVQRLTNSKPKQPIHLEKQLNQLIEQVNGGRSSRTTNVNQAPVVVEEPKSEEVNNNSAESCSKNDVQSSEVKWDDEELFNDDGFFLAQTQKLELNARNQDSSQDVVKTTEQSVVKVEVVANDVTNRVTNKKDELDVYWSDDEIFEMIPITNVIENDCLKKNENEDSFSDLFNCSTLSSKRVARVDGDSFEDDIFDRNIRHVSSPDVLETGFIESDGDEILAKVDTTERVSSPDVFPVNVSLKTGSIGVGSASDVVRPCSAVSTLIIAPSTSNAAVESSSSQPCTQDEIQKKKQAAMRRRSLRLANLRELVASSKNKIDDREKVHSCTQEEIRNKKEEAIRRRQERLRSTVNLRSVRLMPVN